MENAQFWGLLIGTGLLVAFWCRSGFLAFFYPSRLFIKVVPPEPLDAELKAPVTDLEAQGFVRVGRQIELRPLALALFSDSGAEALALASEGIYANLAASSQSELPLLYFFSSFPDGAWLLSKIGAVPGEATRGQKNPFSALEAEVGALFDSAARSVDPSMENEVDPGRREYGAAGACHRWVGADFHAQGLQKASWSEFTEVLEAHRQVLKEMGPLHGTPSALPTPRARVEAARRYYAHGGVRRQLRAEAAFRRLRSSTEPPSGPPVRPRI